MDINKRISNAITNEYDSILKEEQMNMRKEKVNVFLNAIKNMYDSDVHLREHINGRLKELYIEAYHEGNTDGMRMRHDGFGVEKNNFKCITFKQLMSLY